VALIAPPHKPLSKPQSTSSTAAAITETPGALSVLNRGLGALTDMQNNTGSSPAHGNTTMYSAADWAAFAAAAQQLARMAAANGDPATAMMRTAAASVFTTL
jgi:hypothetical protein